MESNLSSRSLAASLHQSPPQPSLSQTISEASSSQSSHSQVSPWTEFTLQIVTPKHKYPNNSNHSADERLKYVGAPLPRFGHSSSMMSSVSGDVFIFGGRAGYYEFKNDTWAIRISKNPDMELGSEGNSTHMRVIADLVETTGETPDPRVGHKSVLADGLLIVWGGVTLMNGGELGVIDNSIYLLNISTRYWTKLDIMPAPSARAWHAACVCGNMFIVFGGEGGGGEYPNDLWSFDLYSLQQGYPTWDRIEIAEKSQSPPGRRAHSMVAYRNKLYMFGGSRGKTLCDETWCFDMDTRVWIKLDCSGHTPPPCALHAVALVGDAVYMFGGLPDDYNVLGYTWSFKINERKWYRFPLMNLQIAARLGHVMTTIEGRVLVLGGIRRHTAGQYDDIETVQVLDTNLINYPERKEDTSTLITAQTKRPYPDGLSNASGGDAPAKRARQKYSPDLPERAGQTRNVVFNAPESGSIEVDMNETGRNKLAITLEPYSEGVGPQLDQGAIALATCDTITGAMSAGEIIRYLVMHGCHGMSEDIDIQEVSEYPVSGGGFGDVYRATLCNGHRVGLKCMRMLVGTTEAGRKFLKHAAHELYVWSKCRHPNILELSGVMLFRGRIAMVSPWVDNGHLRWFLSQGPEVDRCVLCTQIADGVDYLHGQGIVHGDLKPENVLISQDYTPKLTDFGNAALAEYTLQFTNSTSAQSMSVRWTAPEILKQETKTTQAGDIFALGMIIFEAVTGLFPYAGVSDPVVMFSIARGVLPDRPLVHIPTGVDQADHLWSVITGCWAYLPNERPNAQMVKSMMDKITSQGLLVNSFSV